MKNKILFSITSGEIIDVQEDELSNFDQSYIPLKQRPHRSCKHCWGRGHVGYESRRKHYHICRCMKRKCIDYETLKDSDVIIETPVKIDGEEVVNIVEDMPIK